MVDVMDMAESLVEPVGRAAVPPRLEVTSGHDAAQEFDTLPSKLSVRDLDFFYGKQQALFANDLEVKENRVTAIIGPSGCGKSTHLRTYNRIYELYRDQKATGEIVLDGENILASGTDVLEPAPPCRHDLPEAEPVPDDRLRQHRLRTASALQAEQAELTDRVEDALRRSALWDEVKSKLSEPGMALSGGQQQRLCIARAIAAEPELILMDEPCSAIDPVATAKIEELMLELKSDYTIVLVTHNMQQAARVSDYTAFFFEGHIVEFGATTQIFENPREKQTEDYISGRFG